MSDALAMFYLGRSKTKRKAPWLAWRQPRIRARWNQWKTC